MRLPEPTAKTFRSCVALQAKWKPRRSDLTVLQLSHWTLLHAFEHLSASDSQGMWQHVHFARAFTADVLSAANFKRRGGRSLEKQ